VCHPYWAIFCRLMLGSVGVTGISAASRVTTADDVSTPTEPGECARQLPLDGPVASPWAR